MCLQDVSGLPELGPEMQIQAHKMRAWAEFANDPVNGLSKEVGWPVYNASETAMIRLGYNNNPTSDFALPRFYDVPYSGLNLSFYGL